MSNSPLFIAELSINHFGRVNIAKAMIKAAKNAGASYIKLKKKKVGKYYGEGMEPWRGFDFKTYRGSLELSEEDFLEIDAYCKELDIPWFCTVHENASLEFLQQFDLPFYKIASMDAKKEAFVDEVMQLCADEGKPMVISVGGKTKEFIRELVDKIEAADIHAHIMHTVSVYPTPTGQGNINLIPELIKHYNSDKIKIGYSGHEIGFGASVLAAIHGVGMIERHFALSTDLKIHHIECALKPDEFKNMVDTINDALQEKAAEVHLPTEEELAFLERMKYQ